MTNTPKVNPERVIGLRLLGHTFDYIASRVGISAPRAYQICVESRRKDLHIKMGPENLTEREREIILSVHEGRVKFTGKPTRWQSIADEIGFKTGSSLMTAWRRAASKAGIDPKVAK